jgi:alpha-L-fucosidase
MKEFNIEIFENNAWKQVTKATTNGYKRILRIDPVKTNKGLTSPLPKHVL